MAKAFCNSWTNFFGLPNTISSDRGLEFSNAIFNELCALLNINRKLTASFNPRANATAESWNRSLIQYFQKGLDGKSSLAWPSLLRDMLFSYNTTKHSSTGFSPYQLLFARSPHLPQFQMVTTPGTWPQQKALDIQLARNMARDNMIESNDKNKSRYDQATTHRTFKKGDKVLVYYHRSALKDPSGRKENPKIPPTMASRLHHTRRPRPIYLQGRPQRQGQTFSCQCGPHQAPDGTLTRLCHTNPTTASPGKFLNSGASAPS